MTENATAPALEFERVAVPANSSPANKQPNPFDGHFPADDNHGGALRLRVDGGKESAEVKRIKSQAQKAANAFEPNDEYPKGLSARVSTEEETEGKGAKAKVTTVVTVWTRDKITRPRKDSDDAATPADTAAEVSADNPNTATA
jgi:hypothetical protein